MSLGDMLNDLNGDLDPNASINKDGGAVIPLGADIDDGGDLAATDAKLDELEIAAESVRVMVVEAENIDVVLRSVEQVKVVDKAFALEVFTMLGDRGDKPSNLAVAKLTTAASQSNHTAVYDQLTKCKYGPVSEVRQLIDQITQAHRELVGDIDKTMLIVSSSVKGIQEQFARVSKPAIVFCARSSVNILDTPLNELFVGHQVAEFPAYTDGALSDKVWAVKEGLISWAAYEGTSRLPELGTGSITEMVEGLGRMTQLLENAVNRLNAFTSGGADTASVYDATDMIGQLKILVAARNALRHKTNLLQALEDLLTFMV